MFGAIMFLLVWPFTRIVVSGGALCVFSLFSSGTVMCMYGGEETIVPPGGPTRIALPHTLPITTQQLEVPTLRTTSITLYNSIKPVESPPVLVPESGVPRKAMLLKPVPLDGISSTVMAGGGGSKVPLSSILNMNLTISTLFKELESSPTNSLASELSADSPLHLKKKGEMSQV